MLTYPWELAPSWLVSSTFSSTFSWPAPISLPCSTLGYFKKCMLFSDTMLARLIPWQSFTVRDMSILSQVWGDSMRTWLRWLQVLTWFQTEWWFQIYKGKNIKSSNDVLTKWMNQVHLSERGKGNSRYILTQSTWYMTDTTRYHVIYDWYRIQPRT